MHLVIYMHRLRYIKQKFNKNEKRKGSKGGETWGIGGPEEAPKYG